MAGTTNKIKLSEQWAGDRFQFFKKFIKGRNFIFSQDQSRSAEIAHILAAIAPTNGAAWDEAAIAIAYADPYANDCTSKFQNRCITRMEAEEIRKIVAEAVAAMNQPAAKHTGLTLYKAVDEYLADYRPKVKPSRYQREAIALATFKAMQADCDLSKIDADTLRAVVNHFRGRPVTAYGTPMAVSTVQCTVKAIKAFFDWLDGADKWIAPRRFEKLFKVRYSSLRTSLEVKKDGLGVDTFEIAELVQLWKVATDRQRLYIGLALNIGETAQGLASLLKADLLRDGDQWVIDRNRGKTGVRGVYPLWPEVQKLVATQMNTNAAQELLFLTMDGNALVTYHDTSRVDSISKTWVNLLKKAPKVRKLGHKYLRKTGATLIEQLTNSEKVAELYLSHTAGSVAKKHYLAKDFSHLADGLTKLRQQLSPMFAVATTGAGEVAKAG